MATFEEAARHWEREADLLRAENARLRSELEQVKRERDDVLASLRITKQSDLAFQAAVERSWSERFAAVEDERNTLSAALEALREAWLNWPQDSEGSHIEAILDATPTDALSELRRRVLEEAAADLEAGISRNRGGQHVGVTGLHPEFATQRGVLDAVRWLRTRALTTKETDR